MAALAKESDEQNRKIKLNNEVLYMRYKLPFGLLSTCLR
jgi:hypothetical protein